MPPPELVLDPAKPAERPIALMDYGRRYHASRDPTRAEFVRNWLVLLVVVAGIVALGFGWCHPISGTTSQELLALPPRLEPMPPTPQPSPR